MSGGSSITLSDVNVTAPAPMATARPAGPTGYAVRQLDLNFTLGQGSFGTSGSSTLKLTGARCLVQTGTVVNTTASVGATTMVARIYGLPLDTMNQLTVAGLQYRVRNNTITINAGNAGGARAAIFSGYINEAYPDFSESPNSAFVVSGIPGLGPAMKPVAPLSFPAPVSAATAFGRMAAAGGMAYQNFGVNAQFGAGAYFPGTVSSQISAAAKWANCVAWIDGPSNVLITVPQNGNRGEEAVEISPQTGMIGYPQFQNTTIIVRSLFNPAVKFYGLVKVKSDLTAANGIWRVTNLQYSLSSQLAGGPWEMQITGTNETTG